MGRIWGHLFVVAGISVLLSFQNCAGPVEPLESGSGLFSSQTQLESPFAFDTTVNRFAYSSCQERGRSGAVQALRRPVHFTYRFSAVADAQRGDAGIQLNKKFLDYAYDLLPKTLNDQGKKVVSLKDTSLLLRSSLQSAGAKLQLGLHSIDEPGSPIDVVTGGDESQAVHQFSSNLTTSAMAEFLVKNAVSKRVSFLEASQNLTSRKLIGSIGFTSLEDGELASLMLKTDYTMDKKWMVALTYTALDEVDASELKDLDSSQVADLEASGPGARLPYFYDRSADKDIMWGRGFQFRYAYPNPELSAQTYAQRNVVDDVREFDLLQSSDRRESAAKWSCHEELKFKVYMDRDSTRARHHDPAYLPSNQAGDFFVRYFLPDGVTPRPDPRDQYGRDLRDYKCPKYDDQLNLGMNNVPSYEEYLEKLEVVRGVLPQEHWYVHIPFVGNPYGGDNIPPCVIPKQGSCYPLDQFQVMYPEGVSCGQADSDSEYCSEYISVCHRL